MTTRSKLDVSCLILKLFNESRIGSGRKFCLNCLKSQAVLRFQLLFSRNLCI